MKGNPSKAKLAVTEQESLMLSPGLLAASGKTARDVTVCVPIFAHV